MTRNASQKTERKRGEKGMGVEVTQQMSPVALEPGDIVAIIGAFTPRPQELVFYTCLGP